MFTILFYEFLINMAFTMACRNFKKGLKMVSGPLGVNTFETKIDINILKIELFHFILFYFSSPCPSGVCIITGSKKALPICGKLLKGMARAWVIPPFQMFYPIHPVSKKYKDRYQWNQHQISIAAKRTPSCSRECGNEAHGGCSFRLQAAGVTSVVNSA
jgi:hypothetical protein